jgi:hypothetical protein
MLTETQVIFSQIKNGEIEAVIEPEVFAEIIFVLSSFYEFSHARDGLVARARIIIVLLVFFGELGKMVK